MPWNESDVERFNSGLTQAQKRQWVQVANSALQQCINEGNKSQDECESSAIRQANSVVGNNTATYNRTERIPQTNTYPVQVRVHQGEEHLVVPVVMMVEGVHNGSHGPLLHLGEELGRFPGAWNGIPVVIYHPEEDGVGVSANSPDIVEREVIGRVYNTHYEGSKLKGEAWINQNRIQQVSPSVLDYLTEGRPLDVSVGVFTDDESKSGTWNNEEYVGIARNHRPDHLALLPGAQGACSWEDGCGVRLNKKGGDRLSDSNTFDPVKAMKEYARKGHFLQTNQQGYRELASTIQGKLDAMDTDIRIHFLEELFDTYFVYRISRQDGDGPSQNTLYKREYTSNDDGTVEFGENATPVVKKVEYVEQQTQMQSADDNKGGAQTMTKKETPCCPEKVELLIQSENNKFGDEDRDWLNSLTENQVGKLETLEKAIETNKEGNNKTMGKDEAIKVLREELSDPEKFKTVVPSEVRQQIEHGMKLHKEHRQELISHINSNTEVYTEEELTAMDTDGLEKLAKAIQPKTDYSAFGGTGNYQQGESVETLPPPGVTAE